MRFAWLNHLLVLIHLLESARDRDSVTLCLACPSDSKGVHE